MNYELSVSLEDFKGTLISKGFNNPINELSKALDDFLEKGKALPIGTKKNYNGKPYIKTANGWRPEKKGGSSHSEEPKEQAEPKEGAHSEHIAKIVNGEGTKTSKIHQLHALGLPKAEIAKHVGAHYSQVHTALKGKVANGAPKVSDIPLEPQPEKVVETKNKVQKEKKAKEVEEQPMSDKEYKAALEVIRSHYSTRITNLQTMSRKGSMTTYAKNELKKVHNAREAEINALGRKKAGFSAISGVVRSTAKNLGLEAFKDHSTNIRGYTNRSGGYGVSFDPSGNTVRLEIAGPSSEKLIEQLKENPKIEVTSIDKRIFVLKLKQPSEDKQ